MYIVVTGIDIVNCKYSLTYAGSLYPITPANLSTNARAIGLQNGYSTISTIGDHTIAGGVYQGITSTSIYGLIINNTANAQNIAIKCGASTIFNLKGLTAGQTIILPNVGSSYLTCLDPTSTSSIIFNLSAATEVDVATMIKIE